MAKYHVPTGVLTSVFRLPYKKLIAKGVKVFIFDVDGTLGKHGILHLPPEIWELFAAIREAGGRVCLASNNPVNRHHLKKGGIEVFHPDSYLQLFFVHKPMKRYFKRLLKMLGVQPEEAVVIGDDYKRDINGAIKMGMRGYLVNPIGEAHWYDRRPRNRRLLEKHHQIVFPVTHESERSQE